MPGSELFYNYLVICFDRLLQSQQEYNDSFEHERLFRFRVEIKKIRACLKCIENYYGKKEFRESRKQFKKIFGQAGTLRELQLYQSWFRKRHLLRLVNIIRLPQEIQTRQKEFVKDSGKIVTTIKHSQKLIIRYARKLDQEKVYRFYLQIVKERLQLLQEELVEGKWHKTRKQIKQLRYSRNWQDAKAKRLLSKGQSDFLDQLQHIIGFWHDNEMMIKWLKGKQKKARNSGRDAFARAFHFMEVSRKKLKEQVKNKSRRSGKVLRPLAQRVQKLELTS